MKNFYCYPASLGSDKSNILICFYTGRDLCVETFYSEVIAQFKSLIFTKNILFITHDFNKSDINTKLLNDQAQHDLRDRINSLQELYFHTCLINRYGKFELNSYDNGGFTFSDVNLEKILEIGLVNIINKRNLVVNSSSNTHFVKPSGKHSSKFIDLRNILESSPEISFIATNLLKLLPKKVTRIYVDTSGIYPLAFELGNLIRHFDEKIQVISIDSFSSYGGFKEYQFRADSNTVVLISASTSNELYEKLRRHGSLDQANFITIIKTEDDSDNQNVLVEFKKYRLEYKDSSFEKFESYREDECPMCSEDSSIPVMLDKHRFDVSPPRIESYLPLAADSNKELRRLISEYKNIKAFKCFYDGIDGRKNVTPEYFIDVSQIMQSPNFKNKVRNTFINRYFPLNTDCILYCNDSGAKELAEFIKQEVLEKGLKVAIHNGTIPEDEDIKQGIIVVAGSLESGKSLLNISRELRRLSELPITYVIGFAKYNSKHEFEKLKKDLIFSKGPSGMHTIHVIEDILLPINEHKQTTWDKEIDLLNQIYPLYESIPVLKAAIDTRVLQLKNSKSEEVKGLGESLFITTRKDDQFILGKNFAFWEKIDTEDTCTHQATVYFTISSIVQKLRTEVNKEGKKPLGEGYIIRQLDPLLFDRFNEGIIQASILRCAKSKELDYRCNYTHSKIVGTLVERMLNIPNSKESSGLSEFLLALCLKKLQINKEQLPDFNIHSLTQDEHPMAWILAQYAQKKLKDRHEEKITHVPV